MVFKFLLLFLSNVDGKNTILLGKWYLSGRQLFVLQSNLICRVTLGERGQST